MVPLADLESRLGYRFSNIRLLERALTHSSFVHETEAASRGPVEGYEALEFLGDAILGWVISDHLFRSYPAALEGELTRMKAYLVSRRHLAQISQQLEMGPFLRLSRGEEKTGGRRKKAILADLFESVVAAIYLDGGPDPTRQFILSHFDSSLQKLTEQELPLLDAKSTLQESLHARGLPQPGYRVIQETGPAHDKEFLVEVALGSRVLARARGGSKKQAEQKAAQRALEDLDALLTKEAPEEE